jgi:membrane peptidoglycan carboxypeptidase
MRRRDHGLLTNATSLMICGLLAGVVVAAAAFPAVAMSGLAAKAGMETFDKLPSELTVQRSPQISYVYASDGKTLIAMMYDENRRDIPISQVSPLMLKAIVAAEDQNFYHHNGVDLRGIARAFVANQGAGRTQQGASTLTMQYVRQAIAYSATTPQEVVNATEDTSGRKLREIRYAIALEKKLNKQQILEKYLNIAPFGDGAYGIFAASQVYFNKAPKDLTIEEAALLAGIVKAPTDYDPTTAAGKVAATDRRNWVIDQMVKTQAITVDQATAAKNIPITVQGQRTPNGCVSTLSAPKWGFFCDYLYRWWLDQETFGATSYDRERRLKSGGYKIISSLDLSAQSSAKKNVDSLLKTTNQNALMVAAVEPGTGRVRALAVNRVFRLDNSASPQNMPSSNPAKRAAGIRGSYPYTTNPLITGGADITGYQAGSTFKIFTMVAALEKGYPLAYTIDTKSPYKSSFVVNETSPAACAGTHFYCPQNANPSWMNGVRNMWTGFGRSVNTYFVPLEERVGAENAVNVAKRLGIQFRAHGTADAPSDYELANNPDYAHTWGAFTLGVSGTTPLDLANAYATIAADGSYCSPTPVQEIRDLNGSKLDVANPNCHQAVDKEVARAAIDAAKCPLGGQSALGKCDGATANGIRDTIGKPVAGKTGTTDGEKTAAMVVTTKQLAVASILADPDWAQTTQLSKGDNGTTNDVHSDLVNKVAALTLKDYMRTKPAVEFTPPSPAMAYGDQRGIPSVTCQAPGAAQSKLRDAGFQPQVSTQQEASKCAAGTVARTDPSDRTVKGGIVVIYLSNGQGAGATNPGGGRNGGGNGNGNGNGTGNGGTITLPCPPFCRLN